LQILVSLVYTDGEHEYHTKIILTSVEGASSSIAQGYLRDMFAEGTKQDKEQPDRFWAEGDSRCVTISNIRTLSDAEFDFLKHFIDVQSV